MTVFDSMPGYYTTILQANEDTEVIACVAYYLANTEFYS